LAGRAQASGGRLSHCRAFSSPRVRVARSTFGVRVPMVLTQYTSCRASRWLTRCWQLDGCRPQSSANTSKLLRRLAGGSAIEHFAVELGVAIMHHALGKESLSAGAAEAAHFARLGRRRCQAQEMSCQAVVVSRRGQQPCLAFLDDLADAADSRGDD